MKNGYFTIKTIDYSGLGDQLGTQFARLYTFGIALGLDFIYTPIYFKRSIKPKWYNGLQIRFLNIRCFMLRVFGQCLLSSIVNVILLKIEEKAAVYSENYKDTLSNYLGLHLISNIKMPSNMISREVDLGAMIKSGEVKDLESLKQKLSAHKEIGKETVFNFLWTANMWEIIPQMDKILKETDLNKIDIQKQLFSSQFHQIHPFDNKKKQVVLHIRCGDSTTVHLNDLDLIVYDKYLFTSETEMIAIFDIDKDRHSVLPQRFLKVFESLKQENKEGRSEIFVISDGYDLTYINILKNLLKKRTKLRLSQRDIKLLLSKVKVRNDVFTQFSPATVIIGETQEKLQRSIHAIANADTVIWGCGGFAVNSHLLFNNDKGEIININTWLEEFIE